MIQPGRSSGQEPPLFSHDVGHMLIENADRFQAKDGTFPEKRNLSQGKSKSKKKQLSTLSDLDLMAVETGIKDLATQHDHYLYGMPKQ